ncbi:MAG: hypothetical protein MUQ27_10755 [Acidimicrobiia bacterium]|nr:hypothetical protein [Acidimicrobiia bacterium]
MKYELAKDSMCRFRYIVMRWKKRRDEGESRSDLERHQEVTADRLRYVLSREPDFGDQDPKEVEARLRNMVYGTNRK